MGNHYNRNSIFLIDFLQQCKYGFCRLRIQRTRCLVTEQYFRITSQHTCYRNSLLLSSGQLSRIRLRFFLQSHRFQQLQCTFSGFLFLHSCNFQRKTHVVQYRSLHQQIKMLENHPDFPSCHTQLCLRKLQKILFSDIYFSGSWFLQQIQTSYQCTFSCS